MLLLASPTPPRPSPLLQVVRRLLLFGYPSDAKSLRPVAAVNECIPAMGELLRQLLALKQQAAAAAAGQAFKPPR